MKNIQVILTISALIFTTNVYAQTYSEPTNLKNCMQAVSDTQEAKEQNPEIGTKSQVVFDELVELAVKRCEAKEFVYADQLLNIARGMVSSE